MSSSELKLTQKPVAGSVYLLRTVQRNSATATHTPHAEIAPTIGYEPRFS